MPQPMLGRNHRNDSPWRRLNRVFMGQFNALRAERWLRVQQAGRSPFELGWTDGKRAFVDPPKLANSVPFEIALYRFRKSIA